MPKNTSVARRCEISNENIGTSNLQGAVRLFLQSNDIHTLLKFVSISFLPLNEFFKYCKINTNDSFYLEL